jgi:ABC-2 type transport system ATP-binding protein
MIELEQLTKEYGKIKAIEALSFRIETNEIFGLLGPNGAGKSTTIKILTTLVKPTAGRALLDGIDVVGQPLEIKKRIAVVPQENNLDREMSAYDNLRLYGLLHHIPDLESKIEEQLRSVDLWERRNDNIQTFSGGMQRRLLIARAVLGRPKVLFLDEPTIGLDPVGRRAVWDHIQKLRANYGTTIFLTTHYMEEADSLCSRVAIMHLGKLAVIGTPADLKASLNKANVTLEDVFTHYTGGESLDRGDSYREARMTRRTAKRLG